MVFKMDIDHLKIQEQMRLKIGLKLITANLNSKSTDRKKKYNPILIALFNIFLS